MELPQAAVAAVGNVCRVASAVIVWPNIWARWADSGPRNCLRTA